MNVPVYKIYFNINLLFKKMSIITLFFYFLCFLFLWLFYITIIKPQRRLISFRQVKNSAEILFYPMVGTMHFLKNKAAGSFELFFKFLKQRPNTQLLLTNLDVYLWIKLGSPEYQKLLTHNESNYQRLTPIITLRDLIFKDSLFFSPHGKRQSRILGLIFITTD